ncbi:taperin-like [Talpa occidentalis]|uniref:taperin-like n=1 Tax=Talpa occidentalis TaxID=50954 RepID=UPI0018900444|nr:taperin-like [Talpa occidentalis]
MAGERRPSAALTAGLSPPGFIDGREEPLGCPSCFRKRGGASPCRPPVEPPGPSLPEQPEVMPAAVSEPPLWGHRAAQQPGTEPGAVSSAAQGAPCRRVPPFSRNT